MNLIPESSPLVCMGCSTVFAADANSNMVCNECAAPLQRVSAEVAMSIGQQKEGSTLGPEQGYFGPSIRIDH